MLWSGLARDQLAPASFDPQTGLFYVGTNEGLSMTYLTDTSDRPEGYGFSGGGGGNAGDAPGFAPSMSRPVSSRGCMKEGGHKGC